MKEKLEKGQRPIMLRCTWPTSLLHSL